MTFEKGICPNCLRSKLREVKDCRMYCDDCGVFFRVKKSDDGSECVTFINETTRRGEDK